MHEPGVSAFSVVERRLAPGMAAYFPNAVFTLHVYNCPCDVVSSSVETAPVAIIRKGPS